ncbi:MAG: type II secretion system minor pseudopilin GspJ [Gammaproteobacteria bacterium]|nr:type II secretion system minor pseudopilin GspJ [Gammaproteobacteria bacterium]MCH9763808.1 type II secretion system minor pseudopilin GspJ [Gammaproteobacteria bacterium]
MKGYTLIEVIIALAIFAILGTLSVGLLSRAFDTKTRLANQIQPVNEVQLAASRITQDSSQIVARPVREQDMQKRPAFIANTSSIEFTRGGFVALDESTSESTLRRVALNCEGSELVRNTWAKLDGFDSSPPQKQVLLSNLKQCYFSFASSNQTWSDEWHEEASSLPSAFKLHLNFEKLGELALIFSIPGGANAN